MIENVRRKTSKTSSSFYCGLVREQELLYAHTGLKTRHTATDHLTGGQQHQSSGGAVVQHGFITAPSACGGLPNKRAREDVLATPVPKKKKATKSSAAPQKKKKKTATTPPGDGDMLLRQQHAKKEEDGEIEDHIKNADNTMGDQGHSLHVGDDDWEEYNNGWSDHDWTGKTGPGAGVVVREVFHVGCTTRGWCTTRGPKAGDVFRCRSTPPPQSSR